MIGVGDNMKKNGFTLAELIAVLVILSLIAVITVPEVTKVIQENRVNTCGIQLENIKEAAKGYLSNNLDMIPSNDAGSKKDIKITDLVKYGYIQENIINPNTGEVYEDDFVVRVTKEGNVLVYNIYQVTDTEDILITKAGFCN